MKTEKPKSAKSFSLDLTSHKVSTEAAGLREYLTAVSGSDADRLIALWRDYKGCQELREKLAQGAAAGGEFLQLLSNDEQEAVKASFFTPAGTVDSSKVAKALLAVARRETTQQEKKGDFGAVHIRLKEVTDRMIALNNSAAQWYLREAINSKSLSIAARVNVPDAQEFIKANEEAIKAHNAGLRGGEAVGDYFNRQAKKAAKEAGIFKIQRVRARQDDKQWVIETIEEAM